MSTKVNVKDIQDAVSDLATIHITQIPKVVLDANVYDTGYIDTIRTQPLPNEIEKKSESALKTDVEQMVKLLGSYCKSNSIEEIKKVITQIHGTLNSKPIANIRNWTRILTGNHPKIDQHIKSLDFWKNYSELIGTNTITYYADTSVIDITMWVNAPLFSDNSIMWTSDPLRSVSYLRESIRHKLNSDAVDMIQYSGRQLSDDMRRNLIYDAFYTTESGTGRDISQERPIDPSITHGTSLNNDWYNQTYRVMPANKLLAAVDTMLYLDSGGYLVHVQINHLDPLLDGFKNETPLVEYSGPLGVEETFPRNSDNPVKTDQSGNVILSNTTIVDNSNLKAEKA